MNKYRLDETEEKLIKLIGEENDYGIVHCDENINLNSNHNKVNTFQQITGFLRSTISLSYDENIMSKPFKIIEKNKDDEKFSKWIELVRYEIDNFYDYWISFNSFDSSTREVWIESKRMKKYKEKELKEFNPHFIYPRHSNFMVIMPTRTSYFNTLSNVLLTASIEKWKHKAVQYVSRDASPEKFKYYVALLMEIADKKMFKIEPDCKHQLIYVTYKK